MSAPRPDILFVVLDAARAENFSIYGHHRPTTPQLERWAPELAFYDRCISAATWTLPSTASLFTGTYNSTHRLVMDGEEFRVAEGMAVYIPAGVEHQSFNDGEEDLVYFYVFGPPPGGAPRQEAENWTRID